jgi:hypothetical protein
MRIVGIGKKARVFVRDMQNRVLARNLAAMEYAASLPRLSLPEL